MKTGGHAVYLLDAQGHILSWNDAAKELKGYGAGEVLGLHIAFLYPPAEARHVMAILATAATEGRFVADGWRYRKDGSRFWAKVLLTSTSDDDGQLSGFAKVIQYLGEEPPPCDARALTQ